MGARAESNGPEIVAGIVVTPDVTDIGSPSETEPSSEFFKKALTVGAVVVGGFATIYIANRLGVFPTQGPNP